MLYYKASTTDPACDRASGSSAARIELVPTIQRCWPHDLEAERALTEQTATEAAQLLHTAQEALDQATARLTRNPDRTLVLLADVDRLLYDAWARLERIQRYLAQCKRKPVNGRWPSVAARQRDDALLDARNATDMLAEVQLQLTQACEELRRDPVQAQSTLTDVAYGQVRTLMLLERVARLMTEAAVGRA